MYLLSKFHIFVHAILQCEKHQQVLTKAVSTNGLREAIKIKIQSNLGHCPNLPRTHPPPLSWDEYEKNHTNCNALLHEVEYSEYVILKVQTHMRMDCEPHTLLGK